MVQGTMVILRWRYFYSTTGRGGQQHGTIERPIRDGTRHDDRRSQHGYRCYRPHLEDDQGWEVKQPRTNKCSGGTRPLANAPAEGHSQRLRPNLMRSCSFCEASIVTSVARLVSLKHRRPLFEAVSEMIGDWHDGTPVTAFRWTTMGR